MKASASLQWIAKCISRRPGIRFSAEMETAFQEAMDEMRCNRIYMTTLAAFVMYSLFAITDPTILPDVYTQAWAIRFFLVIPLLALCLFGFCRVRRLILRELLLSTAVVIAAVSIVWMVGISRHQYAASYYSGISLIVLFGNLVLGLRFRDALTTSAIVAAIYTAGLLLMSSIASETRFYNWLIFAVSVVISLIANFQMDQDQRRAYLAATREQKRNEELSHAVELLGKLSAEDALTQIANRREFDRRLALEWGRARRETQPLALILIDVDFFKDYNDYYGHPAGDVCLQRLATLLSAIPQRSSDLVARIGGEEFGVLLPGTPIHDAARLAERMREAILELNLPHASSTAAPVVSASFGVAAMLPLLQDDAAELLANADAALYNAKKNGRNRVVIHAG